MGHAKSKISLHETAWLFARVGATSVGGWSTMALLLEKELVDKRHLLTAEQIKTAAGYAQILPGATQVAIASNLGHRLGGFRGALVATTAYLLPVVSLITLFAIFYFRFASRVNVGEHLGGLIAVLCGIILANAYKIGRKHIGRDGWLWLLVIMAFAAQLWWHVQALIVLAVFGLGGLAWHLAKRRGSR